MRIKIAEMKGQFAFKAKKKPLNCKKKKKVHFEKSSSQKTVESNST